MSVRLGSARRVQNCSTVVAVAGSVQGCQAMLSTAGLKTINSIARDYVSSVARRVDA